MKQIKAEILGIDPHPSDPDLRVHYRIGTMEGWARSRKAVTELEQRMSERIKRGFRLSRDTVFYADGEDRRATQFTIGV